MHGVCVEVRGRLNLSFHLMGSGDRIQVMKLGSN